MLNHFSLAQSCWWPLESQLKLKAIKYPQKDPRTTTGPSQLTNRLKFGCSSGMIRPGQTRPRRRREGPPKHNVDTLLMICNSVLLHHTSSRQLHPLQAPSCACLLQDLSVPGNVLVYLFWSKRMRRMSLSGRLFLDIVVVAGEQPIH